MIIKYKMMNTQVKKTVNKLKEPIKLRSKKLKDGSESLYLDIYQDGNRKYEFLKMYLQPEINNKIREFNKVTLSLANSIKAQRIVELNRNYRRNITSAKREYISLEDWLINFRNIQEQKGIKNIEKLESVSKVILMYKKSCKNWIHKIDKDWVIGLIDWLQNEYRKKNGRKLNQGTILYYLSQLSSALNTALQMGKINENPFNKIVLKEKIKKPTHQRQFLTIEDLKKLTMTECRNEMVKYAYMFSCYTGLRISDIRQISWDNILCNDDQYMISTIMKKTGKPLYIPLSQNALKWMPEKKDERGLIFRGLPSLTTINAILKNWCKKAIINKKITYHTSRHTFATLMITAGADLYITSKLMGHSDMRTTQIYAKIIDSKKIEAVKMIDQLFNKK